MAAGAALRHDDHPATPPLLPGAPGAAEDTARPPPPSPGPASAPAGQIAVYLSARDGQNLHDKMRQAYWWITNNAVICPYYDIEYKGRTALRNAAGDELPLAEDMSYSSYVLIPMLTLFTCRRALRVGGPGRGKTTSAI